jgi:hypothetical protein
MKAEFEQGSACRAQEDFAPHLRLSVFTIFVMSSAIFVPPRRGRARLRFGAKTPAVIYWSQMREILETEEHVPIPPMMYSDPFYRITYLIKEEIRKYKWIEGAKGRELSWERARQEWTDAYLEKYEKFLMDTLYFPDATHPEEVSTRGKNTV